MTPFSSVLPTLKGTLTLPGDKSISHRALMFSAAAAGTATLKNVSSGQDVLSTAHCMGLLGAQLKQLDATSWQVTGVPRFMPQSAHLDCGNSGTTIRLLSGLLGGQGLDVTLSGDASLNGRPMRRVVDPLTQMGINITATGDRQTAPLTLSSNQQPLQGIHYTMPMASAQVKSAILLAGLNAPADAAVIVKESITTRDHTERMLTAMKVAVDVQDTQVTLRGRQTDMTATDIIVPGDISSAAFWLVGAAILPGSDITLQNVSLNPARLGILHVLQGLNTSLDITDEAQSGGEPYGTLHLKGGTLQGEINITPDLVPSLVDEIPILTILGLFSAGRFELRGAEELRYKESDRLDAMIRLLRLLKVDIEEYEDGYAFHGNPEFALPKIDTPIATRHDHRLVMALEILNLRDGANPLSIEGKEWAAVSYPAFAETLYRLQQG